MSLLELLLSIFNILVLGIKFGIQLLSPPLGLRKLSLICCKLFLLIDELSLNFRIGFLKLSLQFDFLSLFIFKLKVQLFIVIFKKFGHVVRIFCFFLGAKSLLYFGLQFTFNFPQRGLNHHFFLLKLEFLGLDLLIRFIKVRLRFLFIKLYLD